VERGGDRDERGEGRASVKSGIRQLRERGWQIGDPLGKGKHSAVYRAVVEKTSQVIAVKFPTEHCSSTQILNELAMLQWCTGLPNVVQLAPCGDNSTGLVQLSASAALLTALVPSLTMREISENSLLDRVWHKRGIWAAIRCACAGIEGIHSRGIVHGDIKVANIVISRDLCRAMVCDLGLACKASAGLTKYGTKGYTPPELADTLTAGNRLAGVAAQQADIWAMGVTALCLAVRNTCVFKQTPADKMGNNWYEKMQRMLHNQANVYRSGNSSVSGPKEPWPRRLCKTVYASSLLHGEADEWKHLWEWLQVEALAHTPGQRALALAEGQKLGPVAEGQEPGKARAARSGGAH